MRFELPDMVNAYLVHPDYILGAEVSKGRSASKPSTGPGNNNHAMSAPMDGHSRVPRLIDTIVTAKPIAFCNAKALPTAVGGQARADKAEKWGESATTLPPKPEAGQQSPRAAH